MNTHVSSAVGRVGFMTFVFELHSICIGVLHCDLKTHVNSCSKDVYALKTHAHSDVSPM